LDQIRQALLNEQVIAPWRGPVCGRQRPFFCAWRWVIRLAPAGFAQDAFLHYLVVKAAQGAI